MKTKTRPNPSIIINNTFGVSAKANFFQIRKRKIQQFLKFKKNRQSKKSSKSKALELLQAKENVESQAKKTKRAKTLEINNRLGMSLHKRGQKNQESFSRVRKALKKKLILSQIEKSKKSKNVRTGPRKDQNSQDLIITKLSKLSLLRKSKRRSTTRKKNRFSKQEGRGMLGRNDVNLESRETPRADDLSVNNRLIQILKNNDFWEIEKVMDVRLQFKFLLLLGKGMTSKVWLVQNRRSETNYVMKIFKTSYLYSSNALANLKVTSFLP